MRWPGVCFEAVMQARSASRSPPPPSTSPSELLQLLRDVAGELSTPQAPGRDGDASAAVAMPPTACRRGFALGETHARLEHVGAVQRARTELMCSRSERRPASPRSATSARSASRMLPAGPVTPAGRRRAKAEGRLLVQ
jgi:hypothetical protein